MTAHILAQSSVGCSAFLGGILKNYDSNLILSDKSDLVVVEADEYDRSFHHLRPYMAVITATDADHLDIYGTYEAYLESFRHFTSLIRPEGVLIVKKGLPLCPELAEGVRLYTYSLDDGGDFYARNIRMGNGKILFDWVYPGGVVSDIDLGVPVRVNIENGVAAMALAWLNGAAPEEMRRAMKTFAGARRRFDFWIREGKTVLVDDYAHHPQEIAATLSAAKNYPHKKLWCVFQPHTYTRTKALLPEFAKALSLADHVVVADIYAARETDTLRISSGDIQKRLQDAGTTAYYFHSFDEIEQFLLKKCMNGDLLITMGAGDIVNVGEHLLGQ